MNSDALPGPEWPLSEYSRFVQCRGIRWHVQELCLQQPESNERDSREHVSSEHGSHNQHTGETILLLHGTGASTHSWRAIALPLARTYRVVMCDLPGHGYTSQTRRSGMSLVGMSDLLADLIGHLSIQPVAIVGHSAGAALSCQLLLDRKSDARVIVGINSALKPFHGLAGQFFSPLAQVLSVNPVVPRLVSWQAKNKSLTDRLLNDTGSVLDRDGRHYYQRLLRNRSHVSGALSMMAHWNLAPLWRRLPQLQVPLHLLVGNNDKTVSPRQSAEVARRVSGATVTRLGALGHLAHEESPQQVVSVLERCLAVPGIYTPDTPVSDTAFSSTLSKPIPSTSTVIREGK